MVILPKKEDKRAERFLNFTETCYSSCSERQHHFFMNYIEDWEVLLGASAASIEVSVIARPPEQAVWELWLLEDSSRAELPVTDNSDDTLPMGVVVDYTCQMEVFISEEKILPPAPVLLILSTDGVLCPFHMINLNPGARPVNTSLEKLVMEGERQMKSPGTGFSSPAAPPASTAQLPPPAAASHPAPPLAAFSNTAASPAAYSHSAPPPAASSHSTPLPAAFSRPAPPPAASSHPVPPLASFSHPAPPPAASSHSAPPPAFSIPSANPAVTLSTPSTFSFGALAASAAPAKLANPPAYSFQSNSGSQTFCIPSLKPDTSANTTQAQTAPNFTPMPSAVKVNLKDKFSAVETPSSAASPQPGSFSFTTPKLTAAVAPQSAPFTPPASGTPNRPFASHVSQETPPVPTASVQKTARVQPPSAKQTPSQPQALENQTRIAKEPSPILNEIKEEIAHFQKELDDLKARTAKSCFTVGSEEEMRQLRTESEDLHSFLLEIKETTEFLHGDIGTLKTTQMEAIASVEDARKQNKRKQDPGYRQLLYKMPLDPKSEAQMQEIRRLHQYVKFAVQDVNDVLDLEWDRHLEKKKKQKGLIVPACETLYNTLANNREIINQQRQRLNQLVDSLQQLRLYNQTSQWDMPQEDSGNQSLERELESLRNALSKTTLETQAKPLPKLPRDIGSMVQISLYFRAKLSPVKQGQLRSFLTKRKTPPVRSLAPASLSRSAFLAPSFFEDMDDVSSTSSLSEAADNDERLPPPREPERQDTPPPEAAPVHVSRHAPIVRTASIQPGFGTSSLPFGKPELGPRPTTSTPMAPAQSIRVIPQGADSTMLATKTVKHGAPSIPASQAAAVAALRRQMANQTPATALTESTLQTVPQVVNVKELKSSGPGPNIPTVLGPSVPQSAAQVIHQVLATVNSAKQSSPAGAVKMQAVSGPSSNAAAQTAHNKTAGQAVPKYEPPATPSPASSASLSQVNKTFSFSNASGGFSFGSVTPAPVSSSAPGSTTTGASAQVKDSVQPTSFLFGGGSKPVFGSAPEGSFSFGSLKPAASLSITPADSTTSTKSAPAAAAAAPTAISKLETAPTKPPGDGLFQSFPGGETLGSFSGLRVGQVEEAPKADISRPTSSVQPAKLTSSTPPMFSFGVGVQSSKPKEASSTGSLFGSLQLGVSGSAPSAFVQGGNKPSFSFAIPASTAPSADLPLTTQTSAAVSFGSLLVPATSTSAVPSAAPSSSNVEAKQPDKPVGEPAVPFPQQQAQTVEAFGERSPTLAPSTTLGSAPLIPAVITAAAPTVVETKAEASPLSSLPITASSGQNSSIPSTVVSSQAPPPSTLPGGLSSQAIAASTLPGGLSSQTTTASTLPGGISSQTIAASTLPGGLSSQATTASTLPGGISSQTIAVSTLSSQTAPVSTLSGVLSSQTPVLVTATPGPVPESTQPISLPGESTAAGSTFAHPSVTVTSSTATAPVFGAVATPFAQAGVSTASTSSNTGTGFGTPAFGVAGSGAGFGQPSFGQAPAFWKPPASTSSSFSFSQSSFGTQPVFGQSAASTVASSSGGLFGNSTSSASTFSFGQPSNSSSTSTAGGGLFGQSAPPAFGQSSFGQATPVFGSASSSTTTTSSSGFSFGQSSGFTSNSSGSVFGQSQNASTSLFGQQAPSSGGSLFGASSNTASGGGFFSGLGGKPSQDAANKNPFSSSTTGFGSPSASSSTSLFGNSGAKSFGFGTSSFGEQKSSGTFSTGGSVASQGFGFTSPAKTGGFGAAPVFGSPPTFGGSPGFGGVPAFGSAPAFSSPLGSTGGKVFGEGTSAVNAGGFGFGNSSGSATFGSLASQSTPTFGALSQQGSGFGTQGSGFSGFGSGTGGAAGSTGGFGFGVSNQ
ncbi:nuclear pore complex protein Nup214 isoform 1-T1 [Rhinophrynus dorsalis]